MVEHPLSEHMGVDKHDRRSLSRESSLADIVEGIPPTFAQRYKKLHLNCCENHCVCKCYIKSVYFQISSYLDHKRKLQMKALQRSLKPDLWQSQKQKFNGSITRLSSRKRKIALLSSTKQICTCTAGRKKFPDELCHIYLKVF